MQQGSSSSKQLDKLLQTFSVNLNHLRLTRRARVSLSSVDEVNFRGTVNDMFPIFKFISNLKKSHEDLITFKTMCNWCFKQQDTVRHQLIFIGVVVFSVCLFIFSIQQFYICAAYLDNTQDTVSLVSQVSSSPNTVTFSISLAFCFILVASEILPQAAFLGKTPKAKRGSIGSP